jgi:hypothetical protein
MPLEHATYLRRRKETLPTLFVPVASSQKHSWFK